MKIEPFYDPATYTLSYVVFDPRSRDAVILDPVLDYDPLASKVSTSSVDRLASFVEQEGLVVRFVLETHAHADHLSGAQLLKQRFGAAVGIGAAIREVQEVFADVFDLRGSLRTDGSQFDHLFHDGERVRAGTLEIEILATPGHTPACVTYKIGDALFTGDALFIEDYGTGRCDFPRGSADALYTSVHERLYALPDETRVFVGHDYLPGGRALRYETTIGASKRANVQLRAETARDEFVRMRQSRDAGLSPPRLLYPSVQVNIDAGRLPKARPNGRRYLAQPLDATALPELEREGREGREGPRSGGSARSGSSPGLFARGTPTAKGYRDVEPRYLAEHLGQVRMVDVRRASELTGELGHIAGIEHVPLEKIQREARSWDKDAELVLVCRSGARSSDAATALARAGFTHVMNLSGGMMGWRALKLPVTRTR